MATATLAHDPLQRRVGETIPQFRDRLLNYELSRRPAGSSLTTDEWEQLCARAGIEPY